MTYLKNMGINMKTIKFIPLVLIMLLIIACDSAIYTEVYINNETEYDLELHYQIYGGVDSTMFVQANKQYLIHSYSISVLHSPVDENINYVELYYQDTLVYEQNPINGSLWDQEWIDDNETSAHTLVIRNMDLDIN